MNTLTPHLPDTLLSSFIQDSGLTQELDFLSRQTEILPGLSKGS